MSPNRPPFTRRSPCLGELALHFQLFGVRAMRIWRLDPADIEQSQGDDRQFASILNNLLVRTTREGDVPTGSLRLNLKPLAPDGGADAALDRPIPRPADFGGYFDVSTCWQYKASPARNL